ncbi:hypothetical protein A2U01_0100223, partial [Trifolium medium]|nr:hypothetical protein [Trifolium medium]
MRDAPYESARHADGRKFWCSILADWCDAPLLPARCATPACATLNSPKLFQPSASDLAQRAGTPCAARRR